MVCALQAKISVELSVYRTIGPLVYVLITKYCWF